MRYLKTQLNDNCTLSQKFFLFVLLLKQNLMEETDINSNKNNTGINQILMKLKYAECS